MNHLKKEDGYVLVVIIGILTILSLMTITFATLSRIETRATRNYADSVKCEKIAKAGLEHAIYEIRLDKFGTDTLAYNDNDDGNPGNYGLDENFDASGTSWPGNSIFPGNDYDNNGDTTNDSQWIYFPATGSSSDIRLPGSLRARYAVLITDDREARVNVNVTGNKASISNTHTSNEGWSTFEIDLSNIIELASTGNGIATANDIIDERFGTDTLPGATGDDDPGKIPDPQNDSIDNDGDLIVDEALEDTDEPNEFNSIFPYGDDVPFGFLSEAEIMGTSSYTSRLETIFNYRGVSESDQNSLNSGLTTYSADTIVCPPYPLGSGTSTTMLNINALVNNEVAYTDTDIYDSNKKAQMLVDVLTAGGVPDVERQQMAVNIIDFVDSNDAVTTYNDGSNTYYGIEKTPYINEVEAWPSGTNPKFIELYNPYDENLPTTGGWTIRLDADATIIALPAASVPAGDYYVIGDSAAAGVNRVDAKIANLDSGGEELKLRDNNGIDVQVTSYGSANKNDTRSLNDPRPIPLTTGEPLVPWSWATTENSMGLPNDNFPTAGNDDGWEGATYPSSFFIANRRLSNKGYLGFIHRGSEWSSFKIDDTISYPDVLQYITVTDPSMDSINNDGDDDKDASDTGLQAGDLDGPEYRIPGLINVNTASNQVLQSLPNIGTSEANAIIGGRPFKSIGEVANVFTGLPGNKWDREKPFRSISNLITTRSNVFTVYVTAQITDEKISNVYAEKRILAIVDRSVDPIKVRYFRWITE